MTAVGHLAATLRRSPTVIARPKADVRGNARRSLTDSCTILPVRYLAATIAIFICLQAVAVDNRATNTVANIVAANKWSVAQASDASKPVIIRYRDGFETFPDISAYSRRLTVTWQIAPNSGGLRDESVRDAMNTFEDQLEASIEHDLAGVLTAVVTTPGARKWVLYAHDSSLCVDRIKAIPHERGADTIQIDSADDAKWQFFYHDMLGSLSK